jgi:nucleotide-binding universal stress UspA family protein
MSSPSIRYRVVRGASPVEGILRFMEEARIDLTVMGAHGESGNACYPLGRVTQRVIRSASCPVLTVGETVRQNSPCYQRILVVLGASWSLKHAISLSAGVAGRFEADIHAVWVSKEGEFSSDGRQTVLPLFREYLGGSHGRCLGLRFHDLGVNVHREIVELTRKSRINLIILGKDALPVMEQERIIRDVDCPVIPCCSPRCRPQAGTLRMTAS